MQAKHEVATPELVFQAYKTPLNGERLKQEKVQNLAFSELVDDTIKQYLKFAKRYLKAHDTSHPIAPEKTILFQQEQKRMEALIEAVAKKGKELFNNKEHKKTLILAVDEHLLNFMEALQQTYHSYKAKGFTVLGISIDEQSSKANWKQALLNDHVDWPQFSDLTSNKVVAELYAVRSIPQNFLIDPLGNIIAQNLTVEQLQQRLEELLGTGK